MTEEKKKQVLVPTDFSEVGDCAILHGIEFSKTLKLELSILHVIDATTKKIFSSENLEDVARNKLQQIADDIGNKHNIKVNTIAKEGSIFEVINSVAEEINALIVVMGTHGKKGIQYLIGSYALKVITGSKVPYVVVQRKPPISGELNNIIFPLDMSKETKQKVNWAIYLGKLLKSTIHLVVAKETEAVAARKVKNNLIFAKKLLDDYQIKYEIHLASEPSSGLDKYAIKFAKEINAGLIIIMTEKDYVTMGSPEQKMITNEEQIPVMCINPRKDLSIDTGFHS